MEKYDVSSLNNDFLNNDAVDDACAKRLLYLCEDYGTDGLEAKELLRMAFKKLEIYL